MNTEKELQFNLPSNGQGTKYQSFEDALIWALHQGGYSNSDIAEYVKKKEEIQNFCKRAAEIEKRHADGLPIGEEGSTNELPPEVVAIACNADVKKTLINFLRQTD